MILSDADLTAALATGDLTVEPLAPDAIQPASIDLHLSDGDLLHGALDVTPVDPSASDHALFTPLPIRDHFDLLPRGFILASTAEHIEMGPGLAGQLSGVSTLGRHGLMVHATAGWIDPGFRGQITLELSNASWRPIRLRPGMRIGQLIVARVSSPATPYAGRYQGQLGATAPR